MIRLRRQRPKHLPVKTRSVLLALADLPYGGPRSARDIRALVRAARRRERLEAFKLEEESIQAGALDFFNDWDHEWTCDYCKPDCMRCLRAVCDCDELPPIIEPLRVSVLELATSSSSCARFA